MATPYILDGIFLAVALIIIIISTVRGFFKTLVHFVRFILAAVAAYFFGSKAAALFVGLLNNPIRNWVYGKIDALYQQAAESFDVQKIIAAFPKFLLNDAMRESLEGMSDSGEALVNSATDTISAGLVNIASTALGYLAVFLVALILLAIVTAIVTGLTKKFKGIRAIDRILGMIFGIAFATVLLTVASSIIAYFFQDHDFYTQSRIATYLATSPLAEHLTFLNFKTMIEKVIDSIRS